MASTLKDTLLHLKKKLTRTTDEDTVLSIIHKMSKVNITIDLLQVTGAGKIMRSLAKKPGAIGNKASALLNKWREVVANSQKLNETAKQSKHSRSTSNYKAPSSKSSNEICKQNFKHNKEKHSKEKHAKEKYPLKSGHKEIVEVSFIENGKVKKNVTLGNGKSKYSSYTSEKSDTHNESVKDSYSYLDENVKKYMEGSLKPKYFSEKNDTSQSIYESEHYDPLCTQNDCDYNPNYPEIFPKTKDSSKHCKTSEAELYESITYEPSPKKTKFLDTDSPKHESLCVAKKQKTEKNNYDHHSYKTKTSIDSKPIVKNNHSLEKSAESSDKVKKVKKHKDSEYMLKKQAKKSLKIKPTEAFTSSEATFEDCLSFNDIVSVKKKKSSKIVSNSLPKKVKDLSKKSVNLSKGKDSSPISLKTSIPDEIHIEPQEIMQIPSIKSKEVDIVSTLPQTLPHYRPLPQRSYECSPVKKKAMSNEEAIKFTSSRREKTAVYSGKRNCYLTKVPTLFECCTRVLIDNIDGIEYMGGIPFFLLESMLKRCSPSQLYNIENYNPYLLEDTNELWERHCRRDYRSSKPQENETWRELYLRSHDEQEQKLRSVTANISASIANSNPVRKAKLAYIDAVVKPPRDVARRQAKHGTALPTSHTVKAGPPSKASPRPTAPAINAASTSKAQVEYKPPQKPKVAPLMAKTLKSMKQCFRR